MANIHWYPGHMQRALLQIKEKVKIIDVIVELVDARAPISSHNTLFDELFENKKVIRLLTKQDLADDKISKIWQQKLIGEGKQVLLVDLNKPSDIKNIIEAVKKAGSFKKEKALKYKMIPQPVRAMILGIPNVGKSTLINKLTKTRAASVENKPGHTRSEQWIKINKLPFDC